MGKDDTAIKMKIRIKIKRGYTLLGRKKCFYSLAKMNRLEQCSVQEP